MRIVWAAVCFAGGLAGMAALVAALYGDAFEAWSLRLGMPGALGLSAVFQALILTGGVQVLHSLPRRDARRGAHD